MKDIAITIGCMDMLHAGHINLLKKMKSKAKRVVVFVHDNKSIFENKGKFPVQNIEDRMDNLMTSGLVNAVVEINNADPSFELETFLKNNEGKSIIYVRGNDWQEFPGIEVIREHKIVIEYIKYTEGVSSTKLRDELTKK